MRCLILIFCAFLLSVCNTQLTEVKEVLNNSLHTGLTEKIGNFSIELLYHTTQAQEKGTNLIISPITVWTILAVIAEGAADQTLTQIAKTLRIQPRLKDITRKDYQEIAKWLQVNTTTVELQKLNSLFMDEDNGPQRDFIEAAKEYDTHLIPVNFSNPDVTANSINSLVSSVTHGRITHLVDSSNIINSKLILTSVLYFKGQWTVAFNSSYTRKEPFYDSTGKQLGEVNMMYRRHTYPFANIKTLQARVLEIPYGKDNRLSMLIMLPNPGVSLNEMFYNFGNESLDTIFNELKVSVDDYSDDEIDCFLPRFKIESSLELTDALKRMGIGDLFDERKARLPLMSFFPVHVSRIIHKAEIEVTEEGTVASAASAAEFSNRIGVIRFEANRPFCYLIIEKVTNTIAFGGFYHTPSLF
ncbi:serine protease inhibitor 77Ba-like [Maniola hyperantus]|uniref:serine protease inhibitor 77Ba-like n=1 Tax=Aphantopus hyperantus TaxID=2795564 RepID=UPI0015691B94|nr:serine protease inhibitor 77Ba-like [Maniola hyperantus]